MRSACRKWLFWKAYLLISVVGFLALVVVEVPAFLEAIRIDQQRVAEILDQRRRIITGALTRVLDHRERILNASSREEAGVLLAQIRDRNPSIPGILAMGLLDSDASRPGSWGVVMEGVRGAGTGLLEIATDPVVASTLEVVGRTRSPRITPLFHPKGAADTNQVLVALLSPVSPGTRGWPVPTGGVFLIVADVRQWAQEANIPASLRILGCFLGNEPDNGVVVDVDGQTDDPGPPPMGRVGIELDPKHRGLLARGVPELPVFTPRPAAKTGDVRPPSSAIQAVIHIEDFGESRFRCYVGPSPALYASRSRLAVLRSFPIRAARVLFFGFLLSVIWTVFQADRQQMRQLNDAQQTIQRLDLHKTLIQQELHDHIIQNLTLLGIRLAAAHPASPEGFQKFRETTLAQLDYLRGELRRLLREGTERVDSFDEMVLQVQSICRRMEEQSGARCQVTSANPLRDRTHPGDPLPDLPVHPGARRERHPARCCQERQGPRGGAHGGIPADGPGHGRWKGLRSGDVRRRVRPPEHGCLRAEVEGHPRVPACEPARNGHRAADAARVDPGKTLTRCVPPTVGRGFGRKVDVMTDSHEDRIPR